MGATRERLWVCLGRITYFTKKSRTNSIFMNNSTEYWQFFRRLVTKFSLSSPWCLHTPHVCRADISWALHNFGCAFLVVPGAGLGGGGIFFLELAVLVANLSHHGWYWKRFNIRNSFHQKLSLVWAMVARKWLKQKQAARATLMWSRGPQTIILRAANGPSGHGLETAVLYPHSLFPLLPV